MTTPTNIREGMTLDEVTVGPYPGTQIERSCGITIVTAIPEGDNIGPALVLPSDADMGDIVEVYNIYTGPNPVQNNIVVYPAGYPGGDTINFAAENIAVPTKTMLRFRKISPTGWFAK